MSTRMAKKKQSGEVWFQSLEGRAVVIAPHVDLAGLTIREVATSLSRMARYLGHTRKPYTVAQHCCLVAAQLRTEGMPAYMQLAGLLHDAHEALIGDITSPVKRALKQYGGGEALLKLDEATAAAVHQHFSGSTIMPGYAAVTEADLRMLMTEKRDLMRKPPRSWNVSAKPYPWKIPQAWGEEEARRAYLRAYANLRKEMQRERGA